MGMCLLPLAFVLVDSKIGVENELVKDLKSMKNVVEAHNIYGMYDIMVKVEADTMDELRNVVHQRIRSLDKVRSTLTMIVIEGKY
jgi:DNA-binding Lrp family transcriptional regulator